MSVFNNNNLSSLWSLVPFTKANRDARFIFNKQRWNQEYEQEHERIQQLEQLLRKCDDDGHQDYHQLLKELLFDSLLDTSSSSFESSDSQSRRRKTLMEGNQMVLIPALIHFQRLKYHEEQAATTTAEQQQQQELKKSKIHVLEKSNTFEISRPKVQDHHSTCTWVGVSEKGEPLHCINQAIYHPWKQYKSLSTGAFLPITTGFCIFHQKYCVDTNHRHDGTVSMQEKDPSHHFTSRNVEFSLNPIISVPNRLGLCKECFVLDQGHAPPYMFQSKHKNTNLLCHVPGVQRRKKT